MNSAGLRLGIWLFTYFSSGILSCAFAATLQIQPSADTTLVETEPDNNLGATKFVNAGTSGIGTKNRGLYQFDFSSIPAGSKITSAALFLEVTKQPNGGEVSSVFDLHRVLKSWGEGDKDSTLETSSGIGFPATINEATWNSRFAFTTNTWTSPGAFDDCATTVSSSTTIYGIGDFPIFNSTPQMVADVQTWLDNSSVNFGWLLATESEATSRTARGFGSREFLVTENGIDTNSPPYVKIEFVPPPMISNPQIASGEFKFSFLAESNSAYVVEFKNALSSTNPWLNLTNINAPSESTNILVSDVISTNARFYRVIVP
jgi:hypothetical protein